MLLKATVLIVAAIFVVASYFHGKKNSRRSAAHPPDMRLLLLFYSATAAFSLCVLVVGLEVNRTTWTEAGAALAMIAVIHTLRAYFERSMDPFHKTQSATVRYGFDALANLSTIIFAIFALARGDLLYVLMAAAFSLMMILKELKFRVDDDVEHVDPSVLATIKDKQKRILQNRRAKRRDFFANYIKSYFYIIVGFALLYGVAGHFQQDAAAAIADNGTNGAWPRWDGLWFAVRSIALASAPGHVLTLQIMMGVQFVTSIALATHILLSVYRSSPS